MTMEPIPDPVRAAPDDLALRPYLEPGVAVDSDHPAVIAFARREAAGLADPREIAIRLYYAVRDGIRYDPYRIDLTPAGLTASRCLENGYGFCVTKAALLAAVLRVHGIPARLGFADVRNHLTSARLRATMGTDLFAFHGYTDVRLDGRWVKATPAFNLTLCQKAGTRPLEFDGRLDSVLQPFDLSGRRHMEYVRDRGTHADLPREEMVRVWDQLYPQTVEWKRTASHGDFESEVEPPPGRRGGAEGAR
jgi:transglutaminase-like putative cysteine protease